MSPASVDGSYVSGEVQGDPDDHPCGEAEDGEDPGEGDEAGAAHCPTDQAAGAVVFGEVAAHAPPGSIASAATSRLVASYRLIAWTIAWRHHRNWWVYSLRSHSQVSV